MPPLTEPKRRNADPVLRTSSGAQDGPASSAPPTLDEKAVEAAARAAYDAGWGIMVTPERHCRFTGLTPIQREQELKKARAAITAYHAHLEAEGFVVAPKVATEAMIEAAYSFMHNPSEAYAAMISASQPEKEG